MDGWVLRLGVGAAEAFEYSIGDQGLGFGAEAPVRSTPVHAILGNFLHLDDGDFVAVRRLRLHPAHARGDPAAARGGRRHAQALPGRAPDLRRRADRAQGRDRARRPLEAPGARRRLVSLHRALVRRLRRAGADRARRGLRRGAEAGRRAGATARPGGRGAGARHRPRALARHRPRRRARGAARRAAARPRPRRRRRSRRADPGFGLRIVAESEGAFALAALLSAMRTEAFAAEAGPFFEMLESVDLVAPPLNDAEYAAPRHVSRTPAGDRSGRTGASGVHLPNARDEKRLAVPPYGRSYFELVRRAFQPARRDRGPGGGDRPSAAPQDRGRGRLGRLARRAADRARAHRLAAGRRAVRPGADQPDPARLPLRRGRPAQGRPAPEPGAAPPRQRRDERRETPDGQSRHVQRTPKGTPKITVDELGRKLSDLSIPEEELAQYFQLDEAASTPTRPELKLNPETVQLPPATDVEGRARSAQLLNSANYVSKLRREARFQQIVNGGKLQGPADRGRGRQLVPVPLHPQGRDRLGLRGLRGLLPVRGGRHARQHGPHGRVPRRAGANRRAGAAALGRRQRPRRRRQHRRAPAAVRPEA